MSAVRWHSKNGAGVKIPVVGVWAVVKPTVPGAGVGAGGRPGQLTLRSASVPDDVKVTKPGWLPVVSPLIQVW